MRILTMTVLSRCKRDEVEETGPDAFLVRVKAMPTKGQSNKNALKILAHHLGVGTHQLMPTIKDGQATKTVMVIE